MSKYVQHISGQGEKWELCGENNEKNPWWIVDVEGCACPCAFHLPKSEYREVPPPEVWRNVTGMCEVVNGCLLHRLPEATPIVCESHIHATSYRLRKVQVMNAAGNTEWAFIVEKREP